MTNRLGEEMNSLFRALTVTWLIVLVWSPLSKHAFGETVKNVRFQVERDQIIIFYDLHGKDTYTVTVHLSTDVGSTFPLQLASVSGDVGSDIKPGQEKKVVWDCLKDVENLKGDGIVFEVRAARSRGRPLWPWLVGTGIAGAAGWGANEWMGDNDKKGRIWVDIEDPHVASTERPEGSEP